MCGVGGGVGWGGVGWHAETLNPKTESVVRFLLILNRGPAKGPEPCAPLAFNNPPGESFAPERTLPAHIIERKRGPGGLVRGGVGKL